MTVFILQKRIAEYRIGIFEAIARKVPDLLVLTESPPSKSVNFAWRKISRKSLFGLSIVQVPKITDDDILITGLQLGNLTTWSLLMRKPSQCILWGHGFGRKRFSVLARPFRLLAARRAAASIFYTEGGKDSFAKHVPIEKLFVATNTLALPRYAPPALRRADTFLYFGDMRDEKGIEMLIEAFGIVAEANSDIYLALVGNGPSKPMLIERVQESRFCSRILFYPRTNSPDELKPYLDRAIATVSPLHVGLSVVQSFWAGVPIVTQRNQRHAPEFEYCLNGHNAVIFDGGAATLAEVMFSLLDEKLRQKLSENAFRAFAEDLSAKNMINGFVKAISFVRERD